jgi:hypothetical protein
MNEVVSFTPEQFKELLTAIRGDVSNDVGLGAPKKCGFASGPGLEGPIGLGVQRMLEAGSPRLALAKSLGVPLAPYAINVRATFPDIDTPGVPDVGSDVKIVQDTLIDSLIVRVTDDSGTQGTFNVFTPQNNYFYNFQSGIEATLDVQGAPRYAVAPNFTPLSNLGDVVNGNSHWPNGWILTYQQQLFMSFNARIAPLPFAPLTVVCTYRCWIPIGEMFVQMTNREAFERLAQQGVNLDPNYVAFWCR